MLTEKEEMFVAIFLSDTTIDSMVVSSVKIRCFLLYVDLENRFPISELSVEDSMGKHESQNRKECLSKALVDLIHNEMKTALHSCWKDFRRDNAWNRVMDLESLSPDDIVSFYNQSIKKDLAKVDPRLREILNISNFRDLILSSVTRIYSRQLIEFEHSHGKAIIILSKDEKNLCIVLDKIESSADFSLSIYLRTKEMLTRISESALIPKFVNDIIYLLWKWLYS